MCAPHVRKTMHARKLEFGVPPPSPPSLSSVSFPCLLPPSFLPPQLRRRKKLFRVRDICGTLGLSSPFLGRRGGRGGGGGRPNISLKANGMGKGGGGGGEIEKIGSWRRKEGSGRRGEERGRWRR